MTENEATREMTFEEEYQILQKEKEELFAMENCDSEPPFANSVVRRASRCIRKLLEEIQQYRVYKEIFESHFSKDALELLSDKEEFGKWLERGKWIAKKCDEINRKLESFEAIGTIEEFKALKENQRKCKDCAGCTTWKCDCANIREQVITEFAERLYSKIKAEIDDCADELDWITEIAEEMKK